MKVEDKKTHAEIVEAMHDEASQMHEAYLGDPEEFEAYENIANTISAFARAAERTHKREIAEASARAAASAVSLTNEKWIQQIGNDKAKAILEIANEMERFGRRHWMHDEGQNVRMFGERIRKIIEAK